MKFYCTKYWSTKGIIECANARRIREFVGKVEYAPRVESAREMSRIKEQLEETRSDLRETEKQLRRARDMRRLISAVLTAYEDV